MLSQKFQVIQLEIHRGFRRFLKHCFDWSGFDCNPYFSAKCVICIRLYISLIGSLHRSLHLSFVQEPRLKSICISSRSVVSLGIQRLRQRLRFRYLFMSLQRVLLHNISNTYMLIDIDIYAHRQYYLCTFVQMFMNIGQDIMHNCIVLSTWIISLHTCCIIYKYIQILLFM